VNARTTRFSIGRFGFLGATKWGPNALRPGDGGLRDPGLSRELRLARGAQPSIQCVAKAPVVTAATQLSIRPD